MFVTLLRSICAAFDAVLWPSTRNRWRSRIGVAAVAAATAVCWGTAVAEETMPSVEDEPPVLDCVIMPHAVVDVSSATPGLIEKVLVKRSDTVVAGQVLAELEAGVERAEVALADARAALNTEIQLREISRAFDLRKKRHTQTLYKKDAVSRFDKDQAEKDAALADGLVRQAKERQALARLELSRAQALLALRTVRSPISGVIMDRFKWPGEFVEDDAIVRVATLDPLRVDVVAPISVHGDVRPGMRTQVIAETQPDVVHMATVTVVDPVGDPASGTFRFRLELPNPERRLLGGIKCSTTLPTGAPESEPVRREEGGASPGLTQAPTVERMDRETSEVAVTPPATPATVHSGVSSKLQCRSVGPLSDEQRAQLLAEAISDTTADVQLQMSNEITSNGFIVLAAGGAGSAQARTRQLRKKGVRDFAVLNRGPYKDRVSLGVYDGETLAKKRQDALAALGINTDVQARSKTITSWWLSVKTPSEKAHTLDSLLAKLSPNTEAISVDCFELAAFAQ